VLALQFHLETTAASAEALLANSSGDLKGGGIWVSNPDQLTKGVQENGAALNRLLNKLLDSWLT